jgi:hypothetical protein
MVGRLPPGLRIDLISGQGQAQVGQCTNTHHPARTFLIRAGALAFLFFD